MDAQNAGSWEMVDLQFFFSIEAVRKLTQIVKINFFRTLEINKRFVVLQEVFRKNILILEHQVSLPCSNKPLQLCVSLECQWLTITGRPGALQALEGEGRDWIFFSGKLSLFDLPGISCKTQQADCFYLV